MGMESIILDTEKKFNKVIYFDGIAPQQGRNRTGFLVAYQWWRGVACPPSGLNWGTIAAPMAHLP